MNAKPHVDEVQVVLEPRSGMPDFFESIVQTVRKPLLVLDAGFRVVSANRAFYNSFLTTPEETVGQELFGPNPSPWNIPALRNLLTDILPNHSYFEDFEIEGEFPVAGRKIMLLNARQVYHPGMEVPLILLAIEDITQRKLAEELVKIFAAKLERSNRELQDFASIASHDLQEPLRKIQAFGDRLRQKCGDALNEEGRDYLERMQKAAARMQRLINDLLMFARVETKAQPFAPVDLNEIALGVLSDLETTIEQGCAEVSIGPLPTIDAEPTQMRQLLQNLIGNALKYHHHDRCPVVKVRAEIVGDRSEVSRDGKPEPELCRLFVEDNGIGFDEKYLDRIFTVFQRLHGRQEYEGTGVGLSVCRKIVEHHGGSITARSKPGEGATFVAMLPVRQKIEEKTL